MRKVFLDTETSGLAPGSIAQLSYIEETENFEVIAKNYFFDVDYITRGAEEVTGRNADFYKEASQGKKFADYSDELFEKLSNCTLIAHNLPFDENFISAEFWRLNKVFKPADRFDTMVYFKDVCKLKNTRGSGYKNPKLEELVDYFNLDKNKIEQYSEKLFNIKSNGFHDAMYDTTSMFVAFQIQREILNGGNNWINTFVTK